MYAEVLVEISAKSIDKTFTYLIPLNLISKVKVGVLVQVPFAKNKIEGFVLKIKDEIEDKNYEVKEIIAVVSEEVILNQELLELGKYISDTTLSTLISVINFMASKALSPETLTTATPDLPYTVERA